MLLMVKTYDGYTFKGRLSLPESVEEISKLVISIGGAGPTTYNDALPFEFFTDVGIAFFSYNTRGVDLTDAYPFEKTINNHEYMTYLPSNCIEDIRSIIQTLKAIKRLENCKVLLNGWSEGATLAPLFALKYPDMVDALFLCGYSNENLKETQILQCSKIEGGSVMLEECFNAIERNDNEWLMSRMGMMAEWFTESYNLKSNNDLLPKLGLPIYIFNGLLDGFCDVQGVYKIRDTFAQSNKNNLTIHVFDGHGHGLETSDCPPGTKSRGIKSLLNAISVL